MPKVLLQCVLLSSLVSSIFSVVLTRFYDGRSPNTNNLVIKAEHFEVVDSAGRVRGVFGLTGKTGEQIPQLTMFDQEGREAIRMNARGDGIGELEFASQSWNEGALIVGYLNFSDVETKGKHPESPGAGWGLAVRDRKGQYTTYGIRNDGVLMSR